MLKKVIFSVIAFAIGAMVSVSIQACADDYDYDGISSSGSSNSSSNGSSSGSSNGSSSGSSNGSSSGSSNAYSAWCNNGIVSMTTYDAQGQVSAEHKYTFNSKGWIEKYIYTFFITNSSGKRYKNAEIVSTYTYSSSGDTRYGTTVSTYYNESGQVIQTQRTTDETRLRK